MQCAARVRHGMSLSSCLERCTCRADSVQPCPWRPSVSRPNSDVHFSSRRVETLSSRLNLFSRTFPSGPVVFYVCEDELSSLSVLYWGGAILPQKQFRSSHSSISTSTPALSLLKTPVRPLLHFHLSLRPSTSAAEHSITNLSSSTGCCSPFVLSPFPIVVCFYFTSCPNDAVTVHRSLPVQTPLSPFIAHFLSQRRYSRSSLTSCPNAAIAVHRLLPVPTPL